MGGRPLKDARRWVPPSAAIAVPTHFLRRGWTSLPVFAEVIVESVDNIIIATSWGKRFQIVAILIGKKFSATDVLNSFRCRFCTLFLFLR